jgi:hypothetical protein
MNDTVIKRPNPSGERTGAHLSPLSESALALFNRSFPKILDLVREKYELEINYLGEDIPRD